MVRKPLAHGPKLRREPQLNLRVHHIRVAAADAARPRKWFIEPVQIVSPPAHADRSDVEDVVARWTPGQSAPQLRKEVTREPHVVLEHQNVRRPRCLRLGHHGQMAGQAARLPVGKDARMGQPRAVDGVEEFHSKARSSELSLHGQPALAMARKADAVGRIDGNRPMKNPCLSMETQPAVLGGSSGEGLRSLTRAALAEPRHHPSGSQLRPPGSKFSRDHVRRHIDEHERRRRIVDVGRLRTGRIAAPLGNTARPTRGRRYHLDEKVGRTRSARG